MSRTIEVVWTRFIEFAKREDWKTRTSKLPASETKRGRMQELNYRLIEKTVVLCLK